MAASTGAARRWLLVIAVDLETTGFSAAKGDRVVQIGSVAARLPVSSPAAASPAAEGEKGEPGGGEDATAAAAMDDGESFATLVRPDCGRRMHPKAAEVTGISDARVAGAPTFAQVLPRWVGWLWRQWIGADRPESTLLVAHNAAFDASFLRAEMRRCGVAPEGGPWLPPGFLTCDSLEAAKRVWPSVGAGRTPTGRPSWSLDAVHRRVTGGRPVPDAHDARADCEAILRVLRAHPPLFAACRDLAVPAQSAQKSPPVIGAPSTSSAGWFSSSASDSSSAAGPSPFASRLRCLGCGSVHSPFFGHEHASCVARRFDPGISSTARAASSPPPLQEQET